MTLLDLRWSKRERFVMPTQHELHETLTAYLNLAALWPSRFGGRNMQRLYGQIGKMLTQACRNAGMTVIVLALTALASCSGWIDVQIPPCPANPNDASVVAGCDRVCAADSNSRAGGQLCFAGQTVLSCVCQDGNVAVEKK